MGFSDYMKHGSVGAAWNANNPNNANNQPSPGAAVNAGAPRAFQLDYRKQQKQSQQQPTVQMAGSAQPLNVRSPLPQGKTAPNAQPQLDNAGQVNPQAVQQSLSGQTAGRYGVQAAANRAVPVPRVGAVAATPPPAAGNNGAPAVTMEEAQKPVVSEQDNAQGQQQAQAGRLRTDTSRGIDPSQPLQGSLTHGAPRMATAADKWQDAANVREMIARVNAARKNQQDEESERKKRKREMLFASIGDGLSALSNLYFTSKGAPSAKQAPMTAQLQKRYDALDAARAKNKAEFDKLALRYQQQRDQYASRDAYNKSGEAYNKARQKALEDDQERKAREEKRKEEERKKKAKEHEEEMKRKREREAAADRRAEEKHRYLLGKPYYNPNTGRGKSGSKGSGKSKKNSKKAAKKATSTKKFSIK